LPCTGGAERCSVLAASIADVRLSMKGWLGRMLLLMWPLHNRRRRRFYNIDYSGLYYKLITMVNDDFMYKFGASLMVVIDDTI
jgi:hypothetical protein